jgi:branched-chain amino acid transport system ATP-binding protein
MTLEARGVTVRLGGATVLDDVHLTAASGQVTALIGPNGAGKTTLFNVITGVLDPSGGTVRLDGCDITHFSVHRRVRDGLGRTFQRLELFGTLTVRENLRVGASRVARRQRSATVDATIERLGLGPVADTRSDTLSTGTGRLVELGRALVGDPKVLLLDEPASGQDDEETWRFSALLVELAGQGLAVLLVEHDMGLVMAISDRIHVLDFGHLLASGTPAEVRADAAVQAAYLGAVVATDSAAPS